MRLIKGLLLALVSTTMIYGMDTFTDDGVVDRAAVLMKGTPRVVRLTHDSTRSDTPCIRDVLFGEEISGTLGTVNKLTK